MNNIVNTKPYGQYIVYEDGRVFSIKRKIFLKPYKDKLGYYSVTMSHNGVPERMKLHRLVALMFIPNLENKPQVNHIDGDKGNNNVANLEWCTSYENNLHARRFGLNNVSASNSARWQNPAFRVATVSKMRAYLADNPRIGNTNPNFRYEYIYNGNTVTIKELQSIFGFTESKAYRLAKCLRDGKACEWDGVVTFVNNIAESIDYPGNGSTPELVSGGSTDDLPEIVI